MTDEFRPVEWVMLRAVATKYFCPDTDTSQFFSGFYFIAFGDHTPYTRHARASLLLPATGVLGVLASHSGRQTGCTHEDFGRAKSLHAACSTRVLIPSRTAGSDLNQAADMRFATSEIELPAP